MAFLAGSACRRLPLFAQGVPSQAWQPNLEGEDIAGLAVHLAARVMGKAGDGEALVSRTVRDLTGGPGLRFEDHGTHPLKGIPEYWQLYALA
jgi:class 3 adenylate cyclase